jgi:hypothetical protein
MKKVVFIFGRFQVPTKGHAEMIHYGAQYARSKGAEFRVYTSKSQDPKKNPLPYKIKVAFLKQLFPGINVVDDPQATTAFAICKKLSEEGYDDVVMITGGDRVAEFKRSIGKYVLPRNDPKFDPKKNYGFSHFDVINSGERKAGISGTDMRKFIKAGKFDKFMSVSPTTNKALARKIFTAAKQNLAEEMSRKDFHDKLMSFIDFTCDHLGIEEKPSIHYKDDKGEGQPSFGGYSPGNKKLMVYTKNRHPMDIFRTVAHELVHHKQNLDGRLGKNITKEGATGSKIENEANSEAGKVMRYFGAENPFYFDMTYVKEQKAIILAGTPGSGKDKILKEAILPLEFTELSSETDYTKHLKGNIVINGTSDYNKIATIKEALDLKGYKTIMVFVNTSNEVSKQRNESRAGKGRVIMEATRFAKWKEAQVNLDKFDQLFERVIEVKNDLDLNLNENVIKETYDKLINNVAKEIAEFAANEADVRFENMLEEYSDFSSRIKNNPVGGAGNWGTQKLTDRYAKDTPGQEPGSPKPMRVLTLKHKTQVDPIRADRIGQESGFPKNPTMGAPFDDNASIGTGAGYVDPISRWMVKEETKKMFKEKYGKLAEQKIRETAEKLKRTQRESLIDPYIGAPGVTPNAGNVEYMRPDPNAEDEKTSLFGKKKYKNTKYKRNS